jgi:tyrosine-protein kinase Etk/Wzc
MANVQMPEPLIEKRENLEQEKTIDVLDVLVLFADNRRFLAVATLIGLLVGVAVSLILRPTFKASALILPPQQQQSTAAALVGSLGALAGLSSGSSMSSLGLKNPADMYVGILGSRTIADELIQKFNLQSEYKTKRLADTEVALNRHAHFEVGKDGLIHIDVKDHDPRRASDLANGYVDELYHMNSTLAIGEAAQRKVFFDQQLNDEKAALEKAEVDLRNTEQKTGVIQLSAQAATIIRGIADTRAEIDSSEVQLQAMNTFATEQNPDAIRLQQKIAALREQLANLENSQKKLPPGDVEMPAGQVPQATLEYVDKYRELQYHETLFELLGKQYEAARLDQAKAAPIIQVIDRAIPPDRKNGPPRTLLTLGAGILAFCLAGAWLFFKNVLVQMEQDPERAEKLHRLRSALRK